MASIARKNLLEDIPRFLVAQVGIMFAVGLVTIQTGLQSGFTRSTSKLIDQSRADIWVASSNMQHLGLTLPIPYERLNQAKRVTGVEVAEAVIIRGSVWQQEKVDKIASVTMIGAAPEGLLFSPSSITQGSFADLKQPYTLVADEASLKTIDIKNIGDQGKLSSLPAKLVGLTQGTQSIVFDNVVFTSLETANAYANSRLLSKQSAIKDTTPTPNPKELADTDSVSFILIKAQPGESLSTLRQRLESALPDVRAYSRTEMSDQTQAYWQERSGIGFILGLGAVVGVIVGVVIVGQILYASVSDHIKEFGTLKAMGASDWFVYSIIVEQALWMAVLGYLPGMAACISLAAWVATTQGIVILITPLSAVVVFGTTVLMCVSSAFFAIQKVTRVDSAIVFKL